MALIPNPHVYPPDGYYFVDSEGVKHVGKNWAELAIAVREYRIRNGKNVGNPIAEINAFTCARFPQGCRESVTIFVDGNSAPKARTEITKGDRLAAAVNRWLYAVLRALGDNPTSLISRDEAQRRADICAKCPRQASWMSSCGSCAGTAFRLATSIRRGNDVKGADRLMGCSVLAEDTRTSVWLDRIKPSDAADLPENCWRKAK